MQHPSAKHCIISLIAGLLGLFLPPNVGSENTSLHQAEQAFQKLFEKHDLEREYIAIVEGNIPEPKGFWKCFLKELPHFDVEPCYQPGEGKEAITHFEVLKRSKKYTYLKCILETGRKHQIRVHCQQAGFPVQGRSEYRTQVLLLL